MRNDLLGRLLRVDRQFDWAGKDVLALGSAGGFMAVAMAARGARVVGIDPAADAVVAAGRHDRGLPIDDDVEVGRAPPVSGPITGLGLRGMKRRLNLTFAPLPLTVMLSMAPARKKEASGC
jgi:hypothetical protein